MSTLYVVGIGPGNTENMTYLASETLEKSDVIAGYTVYTDLLRERFPGKEFFSTPMMREVERAEAALRLASEGKTVSMVCSGDAGVYGMTGLVLELSEKYPGVEIVPVPGISAVISGAAVLGAPLMHDFSVISLSDLMTPWEKIEKRLSCAAESDMVICLYNPASRKRKDHLKRACEAVLRHASPGTVCGVVRNIGRGGESYEVMSLNELKDYEADMFSTVFIGNSQTRVIDGKMVTPRGYFNE